MRRAASAFSLRPGMETSMYESLLTDFDIQRIMDSGQVFRIRPLTAADGRDGFLAAAGNRAVLIRQRLELRKGRIGLLLVLKQGQCSPVEVFYGKGQYRKG